MNFYLTVNNKNETWSKDVLTQKLQALTCISKNGSISPDLRTKEPNNLQKLGRSLIRGQPTTLNSIQAATPTLISLKPHIIKSNDCSLMLKFNKAINHLKAIAPQWDKTPFIISPVIENQVVFKFKGQVMSHSRDSLLNSCQLIQPVPENDQPKIDGIDYKFSEIESEIATILFKIIGTPTKPQKELSFTEGIKLIHAMEILKIHNSNIMHSILEMFSECNTQKISIELKDDLFAITLSDQVKLSDLQQLSTIKKYISDINIAKCNPVSTEVIDFINGFHKLNSLTISYHQTYHWLNQIRIKNYRIDISECPSAREFKLFFTSKNFPFIENNHNKIEIVGHHLINLKDYVKILKMIPKNTMRKLDFQHRFRLLDDQLHSLIKRQRKLQHLDLTGCIEIRNFKFIAEECQYLKFFYLNDCQEGNFNDIEYILMFSNH